MSIKGFFVGAWRFFRRFVKGVLKGTLWTLLVLVLLALPFVFTDVPVPQVVLRWATGALSGEACRISLGRVTLGLKGGIRLENLEVRDLSRRDQTRPAASAELVALSLRSRRVCAVGLCVDRLGDGYYGGADERRARLAAGQPLEENPPLTAIDFCFPAFSGFTLELERPSILGVAPRRVVCGVEATPRRLEFRDIRLAWPDAEPMSLTGACAVDLDGLRIKGGVHGTALQRHIRPLLVALDLGSSWPYMDGFTGVKGPVKAGCDWDVDLRTGEFTLDIPIHPNMGLYNGVPMSRADGGVGVHVSFPRGNLAYDVRVGPITAYDADGRLLDGILTVHGTNDAVNLVFNAVTELPLKSSLDVMGVLNDGTLDGIVCEGAPKVTAKGVFAIDPERQAENDFGGVMSFDKGSLFGVPLERVRSDYRWKGENVSFTNFTARGRKGGLVSGAAVLSLPMRDGARARYRLDVAYEKGRIGELLDPAEDATATNAPSGNISAALHLAGPLATNGLARTNGGGRLKITEGCLAQLPLFFGMTEILAENVPGVAQIVNQSEASADFTISNGVLRTENAVLEGSLISMRAAGAYDMVRDRLDFRVRVRLMKDDSLLKYVFRPVTWVVSSLLLDLKLTGSMAEPEWERVSLLEKAKAGAGMVMDAVKSGAEAVQSGAEAVTK